MSEPDGLDPGSYAFTFHLDVTADGEEQAVLQAEQYAQALNLLRPEVDSCRVVPGN